MTIQEAIKEIQYTPMATRVAECLDTSEIVTPTLWISKISLSPAAILSARWITRDANNFVAAERAKETA